MKIMTRPLRLTLFAATLAGTSLSAPVSNAQNAQRGEAIFKKCKSCHQIGEGAKNRTGPVLTGVIGRPAGAIEGFKYSASMAQVGAAGLVWNETLLFEYLAGPKKFLQSQLDDRKAKAKMSFRLKKEQDRRDVIAYLTTFPASDMAAVDGETKASDVSAVAVTMGPTDVCVINASARRHFFVAEATDQARVSGWLDPGGTLCAQAAEAKAHGVVSVFESEDGFEGCSRVVAAGEAEEMRRYVDFDRCEWSSHDS